MRRGYAIQPMDPPAVTVVVPTRGRAAYLEVTLESLRRQRTETPHELLVVDDGATDATPELAERFEARLIRHGERRSLNAARNSGLREAGAPLVAFVDDDVLVPRGWLDSLVEGAERHPDADPLVEVQVIYRRIQLADGRRTGEVTDVVVVKDELEGAP